MTHFVATFLRSPHASPGGRASRDPLLLFAGLLAGAGPQPGGRRRLPHRPYSRSGFRCILAVGDAGAALASVSGEAGGEAIFGQGNELAAGQRMIGRW